MSVSRRTLIVAPASASAVAVATATGARDPATSAQRSCVISAVVERLSWMFARPYSGNESMGFGLRKWKAAVELGAYFSLYEEWFKEPPPAEHLFAAGTVICTERGFRVTVRPKVDIVREETFSRLWAIAVRRLGLVSGVFGDPQSPAPTGP